MKNIERPYLLLTPGPLTTSKSVKYEMMNDWCTWDLEYKNLVQSIRTKITQIATKNTSDYTTVLMQGSGTFAVEATLGSCINSDDTVLIVVNGEYGKRMVEIAKRMRINHEVLVFDEIEIPKLSEIEEALQKNLEISHIVMVHNETTTGILNPAKEVGALAKKYDKIYILDAMSSFGGIEMDCDMFHIDFLISSANKALQGVPGFAFVVAKIQELEKCEGVSRSLSLDLFDQWAVMENQKGKFRFTSPTHSIKAFAKALEEFEAEGGVQGRYKRYKNNQEKLASGMQRLGFTPLLCDSVQSPIITSFYYPEESGFVFEKFYYLLKEWGFVIYPGKISKHNTFRIGNIGEVYEEDIEELLVGIERSMYWRNNA